VKQEMYSHGINHGLSVFLSSWSLIGLENYFISALAWFFFSKNCRRAGTKRHLI